MRLGPDDINACRALAHWLLRGLAAFCLVVGAYLLLKRVLFAAGTGMFTDALRTWGSEGESNSLYKGLALLLVGAALALSSRRLARWIITLPPTGCPRCNHARPPGTQPTRCPECGFESTAR